VVGKTLCTHTISHQQQQQQQQWQQQKGGGKLITYHHPEIPNYCHIYP
jgi:hypothetical protein